MVWKSWTKGGEVGKREIEERGKLERSQQRGNEASGATSEDIYLEKASREGIPILYELANVVKSGKIIRLKRLWGTCF